ncbi:MAG: LacI family transcriptional regulator [Chloroflexi bacterium]|nr:LacI family transcriptional regulator [Chloroflexota bacterium]
MEKFMPTIRDVAKKAGVAPITVSRVINNTSYVSEKTRKQVEAVIEELGYVPNMLGPSLRFKRTMTIALVITDITNPFWPTVARGVEDVAQANGYSTILCNTDESEEKQAQYLKMLLQRRIDGILLVPVSNDPAQVRRIQKQGIPVVVLDRHVPGVNVDIVRGDSEMGACELTKHLLSLGHRQISMLTGPRDVSTAVDRVNGFCRAYNEANIPYSNEQIIWGNFSKESGYELARKAFNSSTNPTALFTGNNFVAIGAYSYLTEAGLSVPDDISMVTFDDIPGSFMSDRSFTYVRQPAHEMGQEATKLLLNRISGELDSDCKQITLPARMIVGSSSQAISDI